MIKQDISNTGVPKIKEYYETYQRVMYQFSQIRLTKIEYLGKKFSVLVLEFLHSFTKKAKIKI